MIVERVVERYPADPRPSTVDRRVGDERKPAVWKNCVVEAKEALETYPLVPSPFTRVVNV
jgi:hypothetical protein